MELISVIIPVYKVESYINDCIQSIQQQTYKNLEIIVVDDGSPDKCYDIVSELMRNDNRIVYVKQENQGTCLARNKGIKVAKGKYLLFVDGDDYIHPEAIDQLFIALLENKADISFCDYYKSFSDGTNQVVSYSLYENKYRIVSPFEYCKDYTLGGSMCMKLFKKELLLNLELSPYNLREDMFCATQAVFRAHKMVYLPLPLYYYRINSESITHPKTFTDEANNQRMILGHQLLFTKLLLKLGAPKEILINDLENATIVSLITYLRYNELKRKDNDYVIYKHLVFEAFKVYYSIPVKRWHLKKVICLIIATWIMILPKMSLLIIFNNKKWKV